MSQKNMPAPCAECPWSKNVTPGALGGSTPDVYIGQAYGPFILPCHMACDFSDPDWKSKVNTTAQCAGAASFRASVGVAEALPDALHKLEPHPDVFKTPGEFVAHHCKVGIAAANMVLALSPPSTLMRRQLARQTNKIFPVTTTKEK